MTDTARHKIVVACGEAAVDEFAHLPPDIAGEVLAYALGWHAITLEREVGDAAALAFYAAIRADIDAREVKLRGYIARGVVHSGEPGENMAT